MTRIRFTERQTLECAIRQGAIVPCARCRIAFTVETILTAEREHIHEIALGGPDTVEACAYSCKVCHDLVTNGNGATTAGSSKNRIAKATEPKRIEKFQVRKTPLDADTVSEPLNRCRRCGEYADGCTCRSAPARASFGGRR